MTSQAQFEGLTIVFRDMHLQDYGVPLLWWKDAVLEMVEGSKR